MLPTPHTPAPSAPPPRPAPPPPPPRSRAQHARDLDVASRTLTDEEEILAARLADPEGWRFRGARSFVARYGFDTVSRLIPEVQAEIDRTTINSPAAFLRWLAVQEGRFA